MKPQSCQWVFHQGQYLLDPFHDLFDRKGRILGGLELAAGWIPTKERHPVILVQDLKLQAVLEGLRILGGFLSGQVNLLEALQHDRDHMLGKVMSQGDRFVRLSMPSLALEEQLWAEVARLSSNLNQDVMCGLRGKRVSIVTFQKMSKHGSWEKEGFAA